MSSIKNFCALKNRTIIGITDITAIDTARIHNLFGIALRVLAEEKFCNWVCQIRQDNS